MKRKWYQFEKIIKIESDCESCPSQKFRDFINESCIKAYKENGPIFAGVITLPDYNQRLVYITLVDEKALR
jgi:hypothetical protein